ncbi:hypothetical protein SteCoe_15447 [Stentor coeruleus]|uniref:Uncharacterized protein n=1 Tax=Stentor coeruleus TaxID=5963 RepID=A0A1R2C3T4_9CILI|nr:hypothetical protein SteCoe_15447 [Stentor coeruleus]
MAYKERNLNVYSQQLVSHLGDLKDKKANLESQISNAMTEKTSLEDEMIRLTERLAELNGMVNLENIKKKSEAKVQYMTAIQETEANYMKVLQNSQNALKNFKKGK